MRAMVLLLLLGAGCSLDAEKFEDKFLERFCAYQDTCSPPYYDDQAECVADETGERAELSSCTFDADAGALCLDLLEGLQCEGTARNFPTACQVDAVYTCD